MTMKTRTILAILACLGWAEAAQAQSSGSNTDQMYQTGVMDRLAGRHNAAVDGLRQVIQSRPEDVDARLNLALALIALDRLDEAERELEVVLRLAPDYDDAVVAQASIDRLRAQPTPWRLDVSTGYGELSNGLGTWRDTAATLSRRTRNGAISAGFEHADRFGLNDTYVEGRIDHTTGRLSLYAAVGGTPDADFRPKFALKSGGQTPIGNSGVAVTVDAGIARYVVGTVTNVQPGLEYTSRSGALIVGARWINVWDELDVHRSGYSLRAIVAIHPRARLRAGFADAPESSDGTTVPVRAVSLGAEFDVSDRLTLRLNGLQEQRDAYDREEISVGFGLRL